jgi:hypothetical protein
MLDNCGNMKTLFHFLNFGCLPHTPNTYANEQLILLSVLSWNKDSTVGVENGYGLEGRVVRFQVAEGEIFFFSPRRPDRPCCQPSLLSNRHQGFFPRGGKALQLPPTSVEVELYLHSSLRLHDVVLN